MVYFNSKIQCLPLRKPLSLQSNIQIQFICMPIYICFIYACQSFCITTSWENCSTILNYSYRIHLSTYICGVFKYHLMFALKFQANVRFHSNSNETFNKYEAILNDVGYILRAV